VPVPEPAQADVHFVERALVGDGVAMLVAAPPQKGT
jgi:hypothetical protein